MDYFKVSNEFGKQAAPTVSPNEIQGVRTVVESKTNKSEGRGPTF